MDYKFSKKLGSNIPDMPNYYLHYFPIIGILFWWFDNDIYPNELIETLLPVGWSQGIMTGMLISALTIEKL